MSRLEVSGLGKAFGATRVVDDLNLSLRSGEFLSLLGPSGCGKTTSLRMIAGLERPSAGRVIVDGRDMGDLPPEARGIGLVSQNFALFPHMTVRRNVGFGLKVRGASKAEQARRADAMLDRVQLGAFADRFPHQLSGGQMQRVALARTLVTEPSVLLLDEPLSNLDAALRGEMRQMIGALQRDFGITTILVTHDQSDALSMSDRVAVMFGGRIVQTDTPHALYDRPQTEDVARFLGDANVIDGIAGTGPCGRTLDMGFTRMPLSADVPDGSTRIVIRPERLAVVDGSPGRRSAIRARVDSATFEGGTSSFTLEMGGRTLRARQSGLTRHEPGSEVWVEIAPDAIHCLPEQSPIAHGVEK